MRSILAKTLVLVMLLAMPVLGQDNVTTIRVWGGWGHFRETTLLKVIDAFEAAHPNIRVELQDVNGDMEGLMVQLLGGVAPDIYMVRSESMPLFIYEGMAKDLTPLFDRDINLDDFLPAWGSMQLRTCCADIPKSISYATCRVAVSLCAVLVA